MVAPMVLKHRLQLKELFLPKINISFSFLFLCWFPE